MQAASSLDFIIAYNLLLLLIMLMYVDCMYANKELYSIFYLFFLELCMISTHVFCMFTLFLASGIAHRHLSMIAFYTHHLIMNILSMKNLYISSKLCVHILEDLDNEIRFNLAGTLFFQRTWLPITVVYESLIIYSM